MYAIVKTGGKQYRVEQGQSLLVERLPVSEGESVSLDPLLYVDGSKVVDQVDGLSGVTVEARVVAHERGPKLRVVKFKPKRGYKRRNGHRQDLTRIEVVSLKLAAGRKRSAAAAASEEPAPVAAEAAAPVEPETAPPEAPAIEAPAAEAPAADAPAADAPKPRRPRASAGSTPKPRAAAKPKAGGSKDDESEGAATPKRPAQRRPRAKPKEEGDGT
jgi:large subunit ribosomal protein L21